MKNVKYIVFWVLILYLIELGLGYLISLIWSDIYSVTNNAMILSFGFLLGMIWLNIKNKKL